MRKNKTKDKKNKRFVTNENYNRGISFYTMTITKDFKVEIRQNVLILAMIIFNHFFPSATVNTLNVLNKVVFFRVVE